MLFHRAPLKLKAKRFLHREAHRKEEAEKEIERGEMQARRKGKGAKRNSEAAVSAFLFRSWRKIKQAAASTFLFRPGVGWREIEKEGTYLNTYICK